MKTNDAILSFSRSEQVDQKTTRSLMQQGLIKVQDTTDRETAPGMREYTFISFTVKGQDLLESLLTSSR
jgi:hypothetical protein